MATQNFTRSKWSESEDQILRALWKNCTTAEIASKVGRTKWAVEDRAGRLNLPMSAPKRPSRESYLRHLKAVSEAEGISMEALLGRRRTAILHRARARVWAALRAEGASWPGIGAVVGRNHATILVAVRKFHAMQGCAEANSAARPNIPHAAHATIQPS